MSRAPGKSGPTGSARQDIRSGTCATTSRSVTFCRQSATSVTGWFRILLMSDAAPLSLLTAHDSYLFNEGSHFRLYDKLGARVIRSGGTDGTYFAVWAPNAERVSLIGDFNGWNPSSHALKPKGQTGVWEIFVPGIGKGTLY